MRDFLKNAVMGIVTSLFIAYPGYGESVTINKPQAWITLRSNEVTIGAQFDTTEIGGKNVAIRVNLRDKTGRKLDGVTKNVSVSSLSETIDMPPLTAKKIGGMEYAEIEWQVRGTDMSGTTAPIGIAPLGAADEKDTVIARFYDGNADNYKADAEGDKNVLPMKNGTRIRYAWTEKKMIFAYKADTGKKSDTLVLAIDAKNGKNAFLSYPDRFVYIDMATDSIRAMRFERDFKKSEIDYKRDTWSNEITVHADDPWVVIAIPWYDMGMVPVFNGRRIGVSVFAKSDGYLPQFPESAQFYMPATWAHCIFTREK